MFYMLIAFALSALVIGLIAYGVVLYVERH